MSRTDAPHLVHSIQLARWYLARPGVVGAQPHLLRDSGRFWPGPRWGPTGL